MLRYRRRTLAGAIGIAATLLLHSILFTFAVWGGGQSTDRPRPPDAVGAGANSGREDGEPGQRRISVMLTPEFHDAPPLEAPPRLPEPIILQPSLVEITGIDVLPLPPIELHLEGEEAVDQDAELMARAKLAGIYESQVRARIERAWQLPQEQQREADFTCLVQIHQRRNGRVAQVELVLAQCEGSPEIQMSLVNAIQAASPLPAPPHPSAFVDRFSLVFHSSAVIAPVRTTQR